MRYYPHERQIEFVKESREDIRRLREYKALNRWRIITSPIVSLMGAIGTTYFAYDSLNHVSMEELFIMTIPSYVIFSVGLYHSIDSIKCQKLASQQIEMHRR